METWKTHNKLRTNTDKNRSSIYGNTTIHKIIVQSVHIYKDFIFVNLLKNFTNFIDFQIYLLANGMDVTKCGPYLQRQFWVEVHIKHDWLNW